MLRWCLCAMCALNGAYSWTLRTIGESVMFPCMTKLLQVACYIHLWKGHNQAPFSLHLQAIRTIASTMEEKCYSAIFLHLWKSLEAIRAFLRDAKDLGIPVNYTFYTSPLCWLLFYICIGWHSNSLVVFRLDRHLTYFSLNFSQSMILTSDAQTTAS